MVQTPAETFFKYAADVRDRIDAALERYSDPDNDCPKTLRDAIRHSLLAPCKRLRPMLVLMSAEACGGDADRAMPAACAVEMVHTYSLIHDDLPAMDDDDLRRGRPSCHAAFGEAPAILAGDALLAMAFQTMAEEVRPAETAAQCCAELARAAGPTALVGGQADDLDAEQRGGDIERLWSIHRRKTGAMFRVSLRLGALTAGGQPWQLDALDAYGENLGPAFQIIDDLLDAEGREADLGKRVQKDSRRGKLTFPGLLGPEESRAQARALIDRACRAIAAFGTAASSLEQLASYVLERNH